jgi:acetyl esterase/lipase
VATRPVFVFVHGGGYSSGDKQVGDLPFHDHVGGWAVRHSMVGVTMNYRLAPNYPWPAGAEDVGTVVEWLSSNISTYGGDPGRIVVAGHSAGASHLAAFLAGQAGAIPREIRAAILLSGVYDVADSYDNAMAESFFGGLKTELICRGTPGAAGTTPNWRSCLDRRLVQPGADHRRPGHAQPRRIRSSVLC